MSQCMLKGWDKLSGTYVKWHNLKWDKKWDSNKRR